MNELVTGTLSEAEGLSITLAKSQLLPKAFRGKPADILLVLLWAQELGIGGMQALGGGFHVIDGKASMSAQMIAALARRSPACKFLTYTETTDKVCTVTTQRVEDTEPTTISYTIGDAQRARLTSRSTYAKHPVEMLIARATTRICRAVYPEVCLGILETDEAREIYSTPAPPEPARNGIPQEPAVEVEIEVEEPVVNGAEERNVDWFVRELTTCWDREDGAEYLYHLTTMIQEADPEIRNDEKLRENYRATQQVCMDKMGGGK